MKKFMSIALALLLICTLSVSVFAAETGTITIKGIAENADYEIYQLLDLQAYDKDANNYYYTVNADWAGFFATEQAQQYVQIVEVDGADGYVEWIAAEDDTTKAAFAQAALAYAQANGINPVKSSKNEGEMAIVAGEDEKSNGVFSGLSLGYYLVDSTVGVLCNLTTTNPSAEITPKSTVPSVDKEVKGDDGAWDGDNTASIGDIVEYRVTITVGAGPESYVLHDKMQAGLTFEHGVTADRGVTSITLGGEALVEGVDYDVVLNPDDGCTFNVVFTEAGMAKMDADEELVVLYNAMINADALVEGSDNEAHLEYGDEMTSESTTDKTETKFYSFDLIKTDGDNNLIDGAEFKLYDANSVEIDVVKMDNGQYRPAVDGEEGEIIAVTGGKVTITGLAAGTYYLEETKAPAGYNMLTSRREVVIVDKNLTAEIEDGAYTPGTGVQVVNKTGNALPETGGMGTVIFVIVGTLAVLGTGVLLVTKKRMAMIQE